MLIAYRQGRKNLGRCLLAFGFVAGVDNSERVARLRFVAETRQRAITDGVVNFIFDAHTPAADFGQSRADGARINLGNKAVARGFYPNFAGMNS